LYESYTVIINEQLEAKTKELIGIAKQDSQNSNAYWIKQVVAEIEYQRLINLIKCTKTLEDLSYFFSDNPQSNFCFESHESASHEMFTFINSYSRLDGAGLNISSCAAKSRLLRLELQYPPYDFLIIEGHKPEAYDAKAFLECVRK